MLLFYGGIENIFVKFSQESGRFFYLLIGLTLSHFIYPFSGPLLDLKVGISRIVRLDVMPRVFQKLLINKQGRYMP